MNSKTLGGRTLLGLMCLFSAIDIASAGTTQPQRAYTLFESGQVRPLAQSPDGELLFAVNTPDNRLEVYAKSRHRADGIAEFLRGEQPELTHIASIPVGIEPVAVAARTNTEVWVVNHLSDSVSIVDLRAGVMRVVRTLLVGDEPRDIVFAGARRERAFITTAHRGQNAPFDPQLTTPGIGRADVWVFDADAVLRAQRQTFGGKPLTIVNLFTDTPRALAVSPDGSRVYAAGFFTGNRTTVLPHEVVTNNGGLPPPRTNFEGIEQPETALIVKFDGAHWRDELGREWDQQVKFSLPDKDVFVIDAEGSPPALLGGKDGFYSSVGTVIFNMAVNPRTGRVYVANTESMNQRRFEGAGLGAPTTRGHLAESRITVLGGNGKVSPRHLNKHINYDVCCQGLPNDENRRSLAFPNDMAVSRDGQTLYVAAFGSSKVGVFSTTELENDTFTPSRAKQIQLSGGGPSGLALDEKRNRLYVLTRFNNSIAVVDLRDGVQRASTAMPNPEPESVVKGRPFLYDASRTSSHGDSACASCHVFGDFDALAWDLGNPLGSEINNPGPFRLHPKDQGLDLNVNFRPLKGPMTTQSLRGMANHGPMHWRGDRTGGNDAPSLQPDQGTFDEQAAFKRFNPAFEGLLGRSNQLTDAEMQAFTDFILQVMYPPNPIRKLDNSLTSSQQAGRDIYFNRVTDVFFACNDCHVLDRNANAEFGVARPGFFGTDGRYSTQIPQLMKIPHLRNLYQKIGMFGMSPTQETQFPIDFENKGDQVRGFGYLHDGALDTVFRFIGIFEAFEPGNPHGFTRTPTGLAERRQLESFLLAYDSNLAPIVGQQVTLTADNFAAAGPRLDLLIARAEADECDLVATRSANGRGYLYVRGGTFVRGTSRARSISDAELRNKVRKDGIEATYTCAPPGTGSRLAFGRAVEGVDHDD